ncbi:hypothetical protein cce_1347 [Crocosphaera subtropica ATCC 51142]|uniref:Ice-binding protein C-terminal domain-containing protein n=1 Tax=Crocosphaera subtropica (strain ATCC 51142 / BH68) TaxID=43989 RepID=B1WWH3_CROS5|nr:hypothetical protein cce_1347 [Crocosphaera subtropica ATCC 51142]
MAINPVQAATFNYFDGTFNDADWTRTIRYFAGPSGSVSETATQSLTGGNPDEFRTMTQSWGNGTNARVYNFHSNAIYDPATQGAIASIDYSADVIGISANVGGEFGDEFAIQQDGRIFRAANIGIPDVSPWQTRSVPGLTVTDFIAFDGGSGPNFSSTGSPIQFGYGRGYSFNGGFAASITSGIDNWSVTVRNVVPSTPSVPEPSSIIGLLGLGLFGIDKLLKQTI